MKRHEIFEFALMTSIIICSVSAQYWFQFGATGDQAAYYNTGAAATIQTVPQPGISSGSMGFWVGENLANGAFIQTGYVIENQSGNYPSYCTPKNCTSSEYIQKGSAEWFYEYFSPDSSYAGFLGRIGPNGSAGSNGTFNRYSFYYSGNAWHFLFNGNEIGSISLGADSSGSNAPVAFGEVANTSTAGMQVSPVIFSNLSFYNSQGTIEQVPHGYSYIGYGVGSEKSSQNPYGVSEIDSRINYFEAGSGLAHSSNGYELWDLGYRLRIVSEYGTGNYSTGYQAYSTPQISEPEYIYLQNGTRAEFTGWSGSGAGSYTGTENSTTLSMSSNITEYAKWQVQYLVKVNSAFGATNGTGWYNAGSTAYYSISNTTLYYNNTVRYIFKGWSNNNSDPSGTVPVSSQYSVNTLLTKEYYVSASSAFGNVTGSGWYINGSKATISVKDYIVNQSHGSRTAFYSWNNGSSDPYMNFVVDKPVNLSAVFRSQYLVELNAIDEYGNRVFPSRIYINGQPYNESAFLFLGENYSISSALYRGTMINISQSIKAPSSGSVFISLPLYNVNATITDLFGIPINTAVLATFSNGTSEYTYSEDGRLSFADLPYGQLSISATYSGITEHASATGGNNIRMLFVSVYDIAILAAVVALAFAIYYISRKRLL